MEWITEFLTSPLGMAVGGGIIAALLALAGKFMTDDKCEKWGYTHGLWSTTIGTMKLGKVWNKIENFFQNKRRAYFKGFDRGADSDDK